MNVVHDGIVRAFQAIAQGDQEILFWFAEGKSSLLPKQGEFTSTNQRPITCLNTIYKWFMSCVVKPVDSHLVDNTLMEREQCGGKAKL